jgi:hypothetical protein
VVATLLLSPTASINTFTLLAALPRLLRAHVQRPPAPGRSNENLEHPRALPTPS